MYKEVDGLKTNKLLFNMSGFPRSQLLFHCNFFFYAHGYFFLFMLRIFNLSG